MTDRLTIRVLHDHIGITPDTPGYGVKFGPKSRTALRAKLTNTKAPGLTDADFTVFASRLNVPIGHVKGVRKVEAPRGAFTTDGRPTDLYERHVAYRNAQSPTSLAQQRPDLFWKTGYGPGGYGPYSAQFDKMADACAYDPEAALCGVSWGAFQVLGENWRGLKYSSVWDMVSSLVQSEAAHLDCFARFLKMKDIEDEFRACRPGDPDSCIPFVSKYNGAGFRKFNYHVKMAQAIKG